MKLLLLLVVSAALLVVATAEIRNLVKILSTNELMEMEDKMLEKETQEERVLLEEGEEGVHGELWAVLVAGSNTWYNYRHQADVCHAYQILHQHGVPDDHIIVMMYDDIAHNEQNPNPGVIINRPGGPNVYPGVPKDYTGDDVTPDTFLKVLMGDSEGLRGVGSGKVLKSGPNDRVFINMVDHGAPGIFAFPNEFLNATDLASTLLAMNRDHRYRQMVVYVESCESGSLFQKFLPDDIEVYAVSASGPNQHSYACYEDDTLNTYLGDVFSVKWMEDTDRENLHQETLKRQFHLVRREVVTSTVMHWGELKLAGQKMSRFLGAKDPHYNLNDVYPAVAIGDDDPCLNTSVASHDVPIAILRSRVKAATNTAEENHWRKQLTGLRINRLWVKIVMERLVKELVSDKEMVWQITMKEHYRDITQWDCYLESANIFHTKCFDLAKNTYALRVMYTLANLCEHGYTAQQILQAANTVCTHPTYTGIV